MLVCMAAVKQESKTKACRLKRLFKKTNADQMWCLNWRI